jgi:hypothetical protein
MKEAADEETNTGLVRDLFVTIAVNNSPGNLEGLFELYWGAMGDDLKGDLTVNPGHPQYTMAHKALTRQKVREMMTRARPGVEIENLTSAEADALATCTTFEEVSATQRIIREEQDVDRGELRTRADSDLARATETQTRFMSSVTEKLDTDAPGVFFVNAAGGTGAPRG